MHSNKAKTKLNIGDTYRDQGDIVAIINSYRISLRDAMILYHRFSSHILTYRELAKDLGLSRNRVFQITRRLTQICTEYDDNEDQVKIKMQDFARVMKGIIKDGGFIRINS